MQTAAPHLTKKQDQKVAANKTTTPSYSCKFGSRTNGSAGTYRPFKNAGVTARVLQKKKKIEIKSKENMRSRLKAQLIRTRLLLWFQIFCVSVLGPIGGWLPVIRAA